MDSEDEIEELSKTMVQVAKVRPGALWGLTLAAWGTLLTAGVPRAGGTSFGQHPAAHCPPGRGPAPAGQHWAAGVGEPFRPPEFGVRGGT